MSINEIPMNGQDIRRFISEVAIKLPDDETHYIAVAGRSALLAFYNQDIGVTKDVDIFMLYEDNIPITLYNAICEVADDHGLGEDWMNDDIANSIWNNREDIPDLDIHELSTFFLCNDPHYFFNNNDYPTIIATPVDELGVWAAKILAFRPKDRIAMSEIFEMNDINSVEEVDELFRNTYISFTSYYKYEWMLDRAAIILSGDHDANEIF